MERKVLTLGAAFLLTSGLAACGGSGDNDRPRAPTGPKPASVTTDSLGCLISTNAEADVQYMLGTQLARNLTWNCAIYGANPAGLVALFAEYDPLNACYKIQREYLEPRASCDDAIPAVAPANPQVGASVALYSPGTDDLTTSLRISFHAADESGPDRWGLDYNPVATNTGNLRLFDLTLSVSLEGTPLGERVMPSEKTVAAPTGDYLTDRWAAHWSATDRWPSIYFTSPQILEGHEYQVRVQLHDRYGNLLDETAARAMLTYW